MLILMKIEDMLADQGCRSMSAGNVEQAITLILAERFDTAMLDVNLNGEKSYAVADAMTVRQGVLPQQRLQRQQHKQKSPRTSPPRR